MILEFEFYIQLSCIYKVGENKDNLENVRILKIYFYIFERII